MGQRMAAIPLDAEQEVVRERYRGALLGLAVGDAVGTTVEFKPPEHVHSTYRHDRRWPIPSETRRMNR
jgi:ADP-ribosylglycohydrolase